MKSITIQSRLTQRIFSLFASLLVCVAGCETNGIHAVKTRGVYTTLLTPETAPLASFNTPSGAYKQYNEFGTNETPLAVITGYDGSSVTLELDDLSNGKILMSNEIYEGFGRTSFQPLSIKKSGDYKIRVLLGRSELDSFKFSVEREPRMTSDGKPNFNALASQISGLSNSPTFYLSRAANFGAQKKYDEAIADITMVIQSYPNAEVYALRAGYYSAKNDWNAALSDWNENLRLEPKDSNGLFGRGNVFLKLGEFEKAISDLQKAVQFFSTDTKTNETPSQIIEGDQNQMMFVQYNLLITHNIVPYERICNSLAWLLATCPDAKCRDGKKAVAFAMEACEHTSWKADPIIDTLAAAYAEAGDFAAAVKFENQALQQTDSISRHSAYQQRLSLYQQHQAFHQTAN